MIITTQRIALKLFVVFYSSLSTDVLLNGDCGLPAIPEWTKLNDFRGRYEEDAVVGYECEDIDSVLIGPTHRQCVGHRWKGPLPRCAKQINNVLLERIVVSELSVEQTVYRHVEPRPGRTGRIVNNNHNQQKLFDCQKDKYLWNINECQIWTFQIIRKYYFNYFQIHIRAGMLGNSHLRDRLRLSATIKNRSTARVCDLERFLLLNDSLTYKIGFICEKYEQTVQVIEVINDPVDKIIIKAEPTGALNITIFCDLKIYILSDSCGSPEKPLNSALLVNEKSYSVFTCREGFYLDGQQKVRCGYDGIWTNEFPVCKPNNTCKIPAIDSDDPYLHVKHTHSYKINGTLYAEPDDLAIYSCADNTTNSTQMQMEGPTIRVCKQGQWTGSQPLCHRYSDSDLSRISFPVEGQLDKSLPNSSTKLFIIIMAMFGSFFVGGVCVALVLYSVVRERRRTHNRPNISIVVDDFEDREYDRQEYASLRVSQCSNEVMNPLYEDFDKSGHKSTLNIPLEETPTQ